MAHDNLKSKHALKTTEAFKSNSAKNIIRGGRGGRGRGGRGGRGGSTPTAAVAEEKPTPVPVEEMAAAAAAAASTGEAPAEDGDEGEWIMHTDPEGRTYYSNSKTGEASWGEHDATTWDRHEHDGKPYWHNARTGRRCGRNRPRCAKPGMRGSL